MLHKISCKNQLGTKLKEVYDIKINRVNVINRRFWSIVTWAILSWAFCLFCSCFFFVFGFFNAACLEIPPCLFLGMQLGAKGLALSNSNFFPWVLKYNDPLTYRNSISDLHISIREFKLCEFMVSPTPKNNNTICLLIPQLLECNLPSSRKLAQGRRCTLKGNSHHNLLVKTRCYRSWL